MLKEIAIIGAGTMGAGIAQLAITHRCGVRLIDVNDDVLGRAVEGIGKRLSRSVDKGRMRASDREEALRRLETSTTISELGDVELVIEAVVEDLAVKREVFAALAEAVSASTVLATNTSSLSVADIARGLPNASRVVGMHFFNPPPAMPLVEIVATEKSDRDAIEFAQNAALALDRMPIRVADTPGFVVNRVARGYSLEALRLLGEGVGGVDEIDQILRVHGKFKLGPFELMDLVGVDVSLAVSKSVWQRMDSHARFAPHEIQETLVKQGHLGRKSGRGFYLHDDRGVMPAYLVDRRSFDLSLLLQETMLLFCHKSDMGDAAPTEQYILARILGAVINEAGLAYSEGVAGSDEIDTAMILGAKYPKGPLAWADEVGPRNIRGLLRALNDHVGGGCFEPAPLFADAQ